MTSRSVLVLLVVVIGGLEYGRWLPRLALVTGAVAVLGLAAINPDAWVAGRNIDRYEATGELDAYYLQSLSAAAAPVIVDRLSAATAACVLRDLPANQLDPDDDEPLGWNLSRSRAEDALADLELTETRSTSAVTRADRSSTRTPQGGPARVVAVSPCLRFLRPGPRVCPGARRSG